MEFKWKSFSALTKQELYELLNLRQEVFVVEQEFKRNWKVKHSGAHA